MSIQIESPLVRRGKERESGVGEAEICPAPDILLKTCCVTNQYEYTVATANCGIARLLTSCGCCVEPHNHRVAVYRAPVPAPQQIISTPDSSTTREVRPLHNVLLWNLNTLGQKQCL